MRTLIDRELYPEQVDLERHSRPRTISVLTVLMFTAIVISYLGAYAVPTALANSGMMEPWPNYDDPRPRWMVMTFVGVLSAFMLLVGLFQAVSAFQHSRTDGGDDEI